MYTLFKIFVEKKCGFIQHNDRSVCALCLESIVCRTASVHRHFQTNHLYMFTKTGKNNEVIKREDSDYTEVVSLVK